jgi:hypothetical protein
MSKLTLSIERDVIDAAKEYARVHKTSLSKLVKGFLSGLGRAPEDEFLANLHSELEREGFAGAAADVDTLRRRHAAEKYS